METRQTATLESELSEIGIQITGPNPAATVDRKYSPFIGGSETFETLRDALNRETRLRVTPPDPWRVEKNETYERSWIVPGVGYIVRLETDGVLDDWRLSVDGTVELEGASRLEAFEAAAERMSEISASMRAEGSR